LPKKVSKSSNIIPRERLSRAEASGPIRFRINVIHTQVMIRLTIPKKNRILLCVVNNFDLHRPSREKLFYNRFFSRLIESLQMNNIKLLALY
jgi:hypothetical protein